MSRRLLPVFTTALLVMSLAGCLESTEQFTLNPDGSGKVVVEATVTSVSSMLGFGDSEEARDRKDDAKKFVQEMMQRSDGIDAWKDISCKSIGDDKTYFKGTAYFRNFNELKLQEISSDNPFILEKTADGLVLRMEKSKSSEDEEEARPSALNEEEISAQIDSLRSNYAMGRAMMESIVGEIRQRYIFTLPGTVTSSASFNRTNKGAYEVLVDGRKILAAMDSMTASEAFWRDQVVSGKRSEDEHKERVMTMLFGEAGLPSLKTAGGKPQFDYDAEVRAAKKKYAAMLKPFGLKTTDVEQVD